MASGRAAPWFCWRMVAATIRFPKTGASQRLGFAIQSERLRMTLGSLRTPKSTLGRCRYHIFRLTHMAYSDVFFRMFFMEIIGGMAGRDRPSWGPVGPTRFFQISRPTRPCWEPALIDGTAVWGAWVTWSYGTVDGCEILHQKDGRNPINNGIKWLKPYK